MTFPGESDVQTSVKAYKTVSDTNLKMFIYQHADWNTTQFQQDWFLFGFLVRCRINWIGHARPFSPDSAMSLAPTTAPFSSLSAIASRGNAVPTNRVFRLKTRHGVNSPDVSRDNPESAISGFTSSGYVTMGVSGGGGVSVRGKIPIWIPLTRRRRQQAGATTGPTGPENEVRIVTACGYPIESMGRLSPRLGPPFRNGDSQ